MGTPRIFASSVWGSDLDRWGAWGFADRGTRDRLAATVGPDDYVLSIGTVGRETQKHERGRLLALMKIGADQIDTRQMVEPDFYQQSIDRDGREKWPYGFPIKEAERFYPTPLRSIVLPRIDRDNLYRVLARHYIELTESEVAVVMALPRVKETNIYSTPVTAFVARLRRSFAAPPPTVGTRVLNSSSGPAATYVMSLTGSAVSRVVQPILTRPSQRVLKIGFSRDPRRRLAELNAYMPCDSSLCWTEVMLQGHDDEINAYAMEQQVFRLLQDAGVERLKSEMVIADLGQIEAAWEEAKRTTLRPTEPVTVRCIDRSPGAFAPFVTGTTV